jgi:hypothetical protein
VCAAARPHQVDRQWRLARQIGLPWATESPTSVSGRARCCGWPIEVFDAEERRGSAEGGATAITHRPARAEREP